MVEPCLLAIDPGLTGALAFFFPSVPDRVSVYDMPVVNGEINVAALAARVRQLRPTSALLELVGPMPRDGVKQAFRFGAAFQAVKDVVAILEVPHRFVTPPVWKKHYRLPGGPEGKEASRAKALQLFPAVAEQFQLVKHHNRAEAALLALYAWDVVFGRLPVEVAA